MDALSRLLMLNAPQGTIDKNCVLGSDWQLPHGAGELSVIRWHALTQGAAKLEMPTGEIFTLRPGNVVLLPQNSAHRLSHVDNESTCIVCGTLRLQHSARYFLTSLPETLFLAPVNHSVKPLLSGKKKPASLSITPLSGSAVVPQKSASI